MATIKAERVYSMSKKLKFYLVERTDNCGYDEFDSCVITADNEETAKELAYTLNNRWNKSFTPETVKVTEIKAVENKIILASYNAG